MIAGGDKLTVTFLAEDDETVVDTAAVDYNSAWTAVEKPAAPEKTGYTFSGWTNAPETVTEDISVKASYRVNQYTITFVDEDGETVLQEATKYDYGTAAADITRPADPSKASTAEYTYTFAGWSPEVGQVTGDQIYTATYTAAKNQYTITFIDEDGTTVLDVQTVPYGETPIYGGEAPTKAADAQYTYAFNGWSPAIASVTGDATYTATYSSTVNKYTVTFVDEDGTVLKEAAEYPYGTAWANVEKPEEPSKEGYTFSGWDGAPTTVTEDVTVTASYTLNPYTLTVVNHTLDGVATIDGIATGYASGEQTFTVTCEYPFGVKYSNAENGNFTRLTPGADGSYVINVDKDLWVHVYIICDVNGDGVVNNKDVTRLMRYIKYNDVEVVEPALDINGDGEVNNKDVTRLMRWIKYQDVEVF